MRFVRPVTGEVILKSIALNCHLGVFKKPRLKHTLWIEGFNNLYKKDHHVFPRLSQHSALGEAHWPPVPPATRLPGVLLLPQPRRRCRMGPSGPEAGNWTRTKGRRGPRLAFQLSPDFHETPVSWASLF